MGRLHFVVLYLYNFLAFSVILINKVNFFYKRYNSKLLEVRTCLLKTYLVLSLVYFIFGFGPHLTDLQLHPGFMFQYYSLLLFIL